MSVAEHRSSWPHVNRHMCEPWGVHGEGQAAVRHLILGEHRFDRFELKEWLNKEDVEAQEHVGVVGTCLSLSSSS